MDLLELLFTVLVYIVTVSARLQPLPVFDTSPCSGPQQCNPKAKYRTIDGSCSNLNHPSWGQAGFPFIRILPPTYQDGQFEPRMSVCPRSKSSTISTCPSDNQLPNVRRLSTSLFPDIYIPDEINTLNLMQYGQVVAHDVTFILNRQTEDKKEFTCCTSDNKIPPRTEDTSPACLPIEVPADDYFYSQFGATCMEFVRARISENGTCSEFPVHQLNSVTNIIDANFVYGNDNEVAQSLRSIEKGKLRVQVTSDGRQFPPQSLTPDIDCTNPPTEKVCYFAGDLRVNQNTDITVYQIILLRLHNYLCEELALLNPDWSDETLYQEARRIMWAILQHITYQHFLPIIIGKDFMRQKGLLVANWDCQCEDYHNPYINPSTYNEFGGSAYRSFHSLVPREVFLVDKYFQPYDHINLDDYYFRPSIIQEPNVLDAMLRGLASQPKQKQDTFFSITVTNLLFKGFKPFGLDLESTDMQRGREFGLPTYNQVRGVCGLGRVRSFEELRDVMSQQSISKLKSFYTCVDDIDLFVGGMMERHIPGTLVGPTNQCIIGEQFYRYKYGDRFFYDNCGKPWSFTKAQRKAIDKTTLAWIFCVGGDDLQAIPIDTFRQPSIQNPITPCKNIPGLDLRAWKEYNNPR